MSLWNWIFLKRKRRSDTNYLFQWMSLIKHLPGNHAPVHWTLAAELNLSWRRIVIQYQDVLAGGLLHRHGQVCDRGQHGEARLGVRGSGGWLAVLLGEHSNMQATSSSSSSSSLIIDSAGTCSQWTQVIEWMTFNWSTTSPTTMSWPGRMRWWRISRGTGEI